MPNVISYSNTIRYIILQNIWVFKLNLKWDVIFPGYLSKKTNGQSNKDLNGKLNFADIQIPDLHAF